MNKITLKHLHKSYSEERILIKNASMSFYKGSKYAIVGKSGCGKTTLLNILSGEDENYQGEVLFDDINVKEIKKLDFKSFKRKIITFIHQGPTTFENLTINDNLAINSLLEEPNILIKDILNLKCDFKEIVSNLSGGEQKRINVIQGISKDSEIILVDEPTANLDEQNSLILMDKLMEISKDKILIFVTHNNKLANMYADEVLTLKNGSLTKTISKKVGLDKREYPLINFIEKEKAKKASKVFTKSEKKQNNKLISVNILTLLVASISFSISLGIKEYFENQLNNSSQMTNISLTQMSKETALSKEECDDLINNFDNDNIYYLYESTNNLVGQINGEEIEIPFWSINKPFNYCEELNDNELIFTVSDDYKLYLEESLGVEDIEDYLLDEPLTFTFELNNIELTFNIVDFFFEDIDEYIIINSSNQNLYTSFHELSDSKTLVIEKNISDDLENYLISSCDYYLKYDNDFIYVSKSENPIISYKYLKDSAKETLPIFKNNDDYWINYLDNLLYFNKCEFLHNENKIDRTIFYSPYIDNIDIGRNIENNNEIIISSSLYESLGKNSLLDTIKIRFNNIENEYQIVGIINEDNNYIYQKTSWAYENFINDYQIDKYKIKPVSFMMFIDTNTLMEEYNNLKYSYDNYVIYSYIAETMNNIDDISSTIIKISLYITLIMSLISIISTILLSKLELENYKRQIGFLREFGLENKDLNKIYLNININRFIQGTIYSSFLTTIIIFIINNLLEGLGLFINFCSFNYKVYLIIVLICLITYLLNYLICKFRHKKTPNEPELT